MAHDGAFFAFRVGCRLGANNEGILLVGHAWNEDCYSEPLLFSKEWKDGSIQVGCNLELLSITHP